MQVLAFDTEKCGRVKPFNRTSTYPSENWNLQFKNVNVHTARMHALCWMANFSTTLDDYIYLNRSVNIKRKKKTNSIQVMKTKEIVKT